MLAKLEKLAKEEKKRGDSNPTPEEEEEMNDHLKDMEFYTSQMESMALLEAEEFHEM